MMIGEAPGRVAEKPLHRVIETEGDGNRVRRVASEASARTVVYVSPDPDRRATFDDPGIETICEPNGWIRVLSAQTGEVIVEGNVFDLDRVNSKKREP